MNNNYKPDYGMDNYNDKQSYGKYSTSYDKSKDSKVKCNNINVNLNGDIYIGASQALGALATEAQAADEGEVGANPWSDGGRPSGHDSNSRFICINNNDNNGGGETPIPPVPPVENECVKCFEEFLTRAQFEALESIITSGGINFIENTGGNIINPESFDELCEQLESLTSAELSGVLSTTIFDIAQLDIDQDTFEDIFLCVAEALDIPIPSV